MKISFFSLLIVLTLLSFRVSANPEWNAVNLLSGKTDDLLGQNNAQIISFFEPECSWCYKQSQVLNHMTEQCQDIGLSQIGIHGKFNELRRAAMRLKTQLPVYASNKTLEHHLGRIVATPMTYLIDKKGHVLKQWRGFQKSNELLKTLNQHHLCAVNG